MTQQETQQVAAASHERVVRASARVLAYRRWNRDDAGNAVFRQLMLWAEDNGESDGEPQ